MYETQTSGLPLKKDSSTFFYWCGFKPVNRNHVILAIFLNSRMFVCHLYYFILRLGCRLQWLPDRVIVYKHVFTIKDISRDVSLSVKLAWVNCILDILCSKSFIMGWGRMYLCFCQNVVQKVGVVPKINWNGLKPKSCLMIFLTDKRTRGKFSTQFSFFGRIVRNALSCLWNLTIGAWMVFCCSYVLGG